MQKLPWFVVMVSVASTQGSAHQSVIQHQTLNLGNNHTSNITQTEQVTHRNVRVCMHVATINFIKAMNFKERKEGVWEGLE